ncbi:outer membrane protein assembly factor BamD [Parasediminibacterium sp. JCM 36343]|uniref:outer membrane protein assembly factor BamD n=1 Tax=Parasediminibacterium sp. JCM 36343 TaxID=3374279 RepID=UPI00397D9EA9
MLRIFIFFSLVICLGSCTSKFARIQKSNDFEYKYKMAEEYYKEKKYTFAQQLFESLTPYVRGTAKYEELFYMLAYSYYYQEDYVNAENLFKTFTETFPASNRTEECDYMRAYTYYKQSPKVDLDQANTTKAAGLFQAFISTHPSSARVKEATDLIDACREKLELKDYKAAELYYSLGYYKGAAVSFGTLLENYPDSKHGEEYKLTAIKAYYKYAELSYEEKQKERFEKVVSECADFKERYPDSKLLSSINEYKSQANNFLKSIKK